MRRIALLSLLAVAAVAAPARAQNAPGGCSQKWEIQSGDVEQVNGANHTILVRNVQINCNDVQLFADQVELISDADRLRATGNVVFVSTGNRISADRLDFNTRTKTGTFYVASGIANLEARGVDRSFFGTQEPDAFFWGETIEKLGPRTYKITHGGFTTCVQPTPRWQLVATSIVLTLEKHASLTNALMKVKDVPVFYIPAMYYPINKEDRATGFLIPIYGSSSVNGQTIRNAFFWAINRSQDATFYGDYFSKTGYGIGSQYRYALTNGSGNVAFNTVRQHEASYDQPDGSVNIVPGIDSYTVTGTLTQALPDNLRATAHADYFSSIVAQQRYQQNIAAATNRSRAFGGNIIGSWGAHTVSGTVERDEVFTDATDSITSGTLPRVNYTLAEQKLPDIPVYVGLTGEYVTLIRTSQTESTTPPLNIDAGVSRLDVFPTVRFPFTKLPYLTFNSTLGFRETYWTGQNNPSMDPLAVQLQPVVPQSIFRRYFTLGTTITGPTFERIFNTPGNNYAEKFKHVIEPTFTIQRTTNFDNYLQIVKYEGTDYIQGGVTSMTYGVNNRLYAKKQTSRDILDVSVTQTYYSRASAGAYDTNYQSASFTTDPTLFPQTNFSPVALTVHVSPTLVTDASMRLEYDAHVHSLRSMSSSGSFTHGWVTGTAQWSLLHSTPLHVTDQVMTTSHFLNGGATVRKPGNGFGGSYQFNYDILNTAFVSQTILGHYNTQCCGIIVEYQKFNYGTQSAAVIGVPKDHRFNISFTLAGIGTFSDLFGAFGGGLGGTRTQ